VGGGRWAVCVFAAENSSRPMLPLTPCRRDQGWKKVLDSKSGRYYFWQTATNEVQWHKPFEMDVDELDDADDLLRGTGIESHDYKILEASADKDVDEMFTGTEDLAKKIQLVRRHLDAVALVRDALRRCRTWCLLNLSAADVRRHGAAVIGFSLWRHCTRWALKSLRARKRRKSLRRSKSRRRRRGSRAHAPGLQRKKAARAGTTSR
jgi:hypothetical protein